jgi:hypothetical protein
VYLRKLADRVADWANTPPKHEHARTAKLERRQRTDQLLRKQSADAAAATLPEPRTEPA